MNRFFTFLFWFVVIAFGIPVFVIVATSLVPKLSTGDERVEETYNEIVKSSPSQVTSGPHFLKPFIHSLKQPNCSAVKLQRASRVRSSRGNYEFMTCRNGEIKL